MVSRPDAASLCDVCAARPVRCVLGGTVGLCAGCALGLPRETQALGVEHHGCEHRCPTCGAILDAARCAHITLVTQGNLLSARRPANRLAVCRSCATVCNNRRVARFAHLQAAAGWHVNTDRIVARLQALASTYPNTRRYVDGQIALLRRSYAHAAHVKPRRLNRLERIADRDGFGCVWCARDVDLSDSACATYEHVIPRSQGGPNSRTNLVIACQDCNAQRGDRDVSDWTADCERRGLTVNRKALAAALRRVESGGGAPRRCGAPPAVSVAR